MIDNVHWSLKLSGGSLKILQQEQIQRGVKMKSRTPICIRGADKNPHARMHTQNYYFNQTENIRAEKLSGLQYGCTQRNMFVSTFENS